MSPTNSPGKLGIVLSGGGSRAAFQVGALKALDEALKLSPRPISVVVGTSVGAINGIVLSACLNHSLSDGVVQLELLWNRRTYKNTFYGHMSRSFLRAIQVAMLRYRSPGPVATSLSIFDPRPLTEELDAVLQDYGSLHVDRRNPTLDAIAVMTTVEGVKRRPLLLASTRLEIDPRTLAGSTFEILLLDELTAAHGLASAALPSVLPAVDLNVDRRQVRLVDGGICDNIPVDPAMRLGATEIITIDSSGRRWWFDQFAEPHDTRPTWEIPAGESTFCIMPPRMIECMNHQSLGPLLKMAVGRSTKDFIAALGPTWPIFKILKHKMGEELAFEVLSYAALHPEYTAALIEEGYREAKESFSKPSFLDPADNETQSPTGQWVN